MKRAFRLARSTDFERVRHTGKSFPHPLVILLIAPNEGAQPRVGIAAGKGVGCAVRRNRAKRLLRASIASLLSRLVTGWDMIFLARRGLPEAGYAKTLAVVEYLLLKAGLLGPDAMLDERRLPE